MIWRHYNIAIRIAYYPRTLSGKWSVGLVAAFFIFMVVFFLVAASGQKGGAAFFSNLALAFPITLAAASGLAGLVTGLLGVIREQERALTVYFAIMVGIVVVLWGISEIAFPH